LYYSIELDAENRLRNDEERNRLIQKMIGANKGGSSGKKITKDRSYHFHCND